MDKRIKKLVAKIKAEPDIELTPEEVDQQLNRIWQLSGQYKQSSTPNFDTERNLASLKARIQKEKSETKIRRLPRWRSAAAILVLLLAAAWLFNAYLSPAEHQELMVNRQDTVQSITLSDGTQVDLYPNAALEYPDHFRKKSNREVQLSGDAHFKVSADPQHPFLIQTANSQVKVVGTEFMLRSGDAQRTTIEVMEGKVLFLNKQSQQELTLQANEVGICRLDGILYQEPMQMEGSFMVNLRNQPLIRLFDQLERHHEWTFSVSEELKKCRLTGTFDVSQPEKVLRQINEFPNYTVYKKEEGKYEVTGSCQ